MPMDSAAVLMLRLRSSRLVSPHLPISGEHLGPWLDGAVPFGYLVRCAHSACPNCIARRVQVMQRLILNRAKT
jgi:hypothetical protein